MACMYSLLNRLSILVLLTHPFFTYAENSSEKKSKDLTQIAMGLYIAEKATAPLRFVARNGMQSAKWLAKNPTRATIFVTSCLLSAKRPASMRHVLGVLSKASGTTLRTSASITRGISMTQDKLGKGLQQIGTKLLQENSSPIITKKAPYRLQKQLTIGVAAGTSSRLLPKNVHTLCKPTYPTQERD